MNLIAFKIVVLLGVFIVSNCISEEDLEKLYCDLKLPDDKLAGLEKCDSILPQEVIIIIL